MRPDGACRLPAPPSGHASSSALRRWGLLSTAGGLALYSAVAMQQPAHADAAEPLAKVRSAIWSPMHQPDAVKVVASAPLHVRYSPDNTDATISMWARSIAIDTCQHAYIVPQYA